METFVIGKTRSSMVISSQSYADGVTSPDDMFDTWAMLEAYCVRELEKKGRTEVFEALFKQSRHWHKVLEQDGNLGILESKLNLLTYAARIEFGKRLLNLEFKD